MSKALASRSSPLTPISKVEDLLSKLPRPCHFNTLAPNTGSNKVGGSPFQKLQTCPVILSFTELQPMEPLASEFLSPRSPPLLSCLLGNFLCATFRWHRILPQPPWECPEATCTYRGSNEVEGAGHSMVFASMGLKSDPTTWGTHHSPGRYSAHGPHCP